MHGTSFRIVRMYNSGNGRAVTNGAGVVAYSLLNNVLVEYALPITIGTVIGAQIGCSLAKRVKGKALRKMLPWLPFSPD